MTKDDDHYSIEEEHEQDWLFMIEGTNEASGEMASGSGNLIGNAIRKMQGEFDEEEAAAIDKAHVDYLIREHDEEDQDGWLVSIEKDNENDEQGEIG
eukprot:697888-Heterocapsa_arctica.AAC.1